MLTVDYKLLNRSLQKSQPSFWEVNTIRGKKITMQIYKYYTQKTMICFSQNRTLKLHLILAPL